jgi:hypothetical protein
MKTPKSLSASTSNDVADTGGAGTPDEFEHEYFQRRRTPRNLIAERET